MPQPVESAAAVVPAGSACAASARPQPGYLGRPACFAWWHAPTGPAASADPVVLCAPWGDEDLVAHQSLRLLAERLAAAGLTVLRFDAPGFGDSAPLGAHDGGGLMAHERAIGQAIEALRARTGAARVQLLGLRLGASLAAVVGAGRDDVSALVAVAPVLSGRALLREWKLLAPVDRPSGPSGLPEGAVLAGGCVLDAASVEHLRRLDLTRLAVPPTLRMQVLDRVERPGAAAWVEALVARGIAVDHRLLPGYDGLETAAWLSTVPEAILAAAFEALVAGPASGTAPRPAIEPGGPPSLTAPAAGDEPPAWIETPFQRLLFARSDRPPVAGIATRPAGVGGALAGWGLLVLNTGAERRIGPHGQMPALLRAAAGQGALGWRMDLAGLGDSPAWPGHPEQRAYPPEALEQIAAAVDQLRRESGVRRVAVLGLCSGAFHAWRAAVDGLAIDAAIVVNPLLFTYDPTVCEPRQTGTAVPVTAVDAVADAAEVEFLAGRLLQRLRDPEAWRKLLSGGANLRFIGQLLLRRIRLALQPPVDEGEAGAPAGPSLVAELERVVARGVRLHLVIARGDPGEALLQAGAGAWLAAGSGGTAISLDRLDDADHTLSTPAARARLTERILARLAAP